MCDGAAVHDLAVLRVYHASAPAVYAPGIATPCSAHERSGVGMSSHPVTTPPTSTAPNRADEPRAADRYLPRTEHHAGARAPIVGPHDRQHSVCSFVHAPGLLTRQGSAARRPPNGRPAHNTSVAVSAATRVREQHTGPYGATAIRTVVTSESRSARSRPRVLHPCTKTHRPCVAGHVARKTG